MNQLKNSIANIGFLQKKLWTWVSPEALQYNFNKITCVLWMSNDTISKHTEHKFYWTSINEDLRSQKQVFLTFYSPLLPSIYYKQTRDSRHGHRSYTHIFWWQELLNSHINNISTCKTWSNGISTEFPVFFHSFSKI